MLAQDLLPLLRGFALKTKSPSVDLRQFHASLPKGQAQQAELETAVNELAASGAVEIASGAGGARFVTLPDFPLVALADEYRQLTVEPTRPFPRVETLPVPLPQTSITNADVKAQLGILMEKSVEGGTGVVQLQFPDGVDSLVAPLACIGGDLIDAAVAKMSRYLQDGKNAAYAETKLLGALKGGELQVRQAMEDVSLRPKKAAATVLSPTDFAFRFWTHLANLVLADFKAKKEKTEQDHGICQSAYLIGYTVFHKKGAVQKEKELAEDRKGLEAQVRKAPFVFGFQELYDLKDAKGAKYSAKHSRDFIHTYLKEKTVRAGDAGIPEMVRVHAVAQKKDYFIHRDLLVPVFLKKLAEAAEDLRKDILDEWTEALRNEHTPPASVSDAALRREVELRVKQGYPLLSALANGALLFLAGDEAKISEEAKAELAKCFAVENILRPFDELLGLSRTALLKNARMYLPFWMTMPVFGGLLRFFRRLFRGRPKTVPPADLDDAGTGESEETGESARGGESTESAQKTAAERENQLRFRRSVQSLVSTYVPKGSTIDATLSELAEKWNPLYDPTQKRNLVEDVNALVRDFLRPIRRSFLVRPPDLRRVRDLAEQLSTSKSLSQIKRKDVLRRYIELYMVRCLQVKNL
jgi:hypothetical protein